MAQTEREVQICFRAVQDENNRNNDFIIIFSLHPESLSILGLSQDTSYGWETPLSADTSGWLWPENHKETNAGKVDYKRANTNSGITLKGTIYPNIVSKETNASHSPAKELKALKEQAKNGVKMHIVLEDGTHYKDVGRGEWCIERIQTDSSNFYTGLYSAKIEFSITIKEFYS